MTGTLKLFITAAIITCGTAVYSQTDDTANKVLEKVVEALLNGDCDRAQRNYNIWTDIAGKTNTDIEAEIKDCKPLPQGDVNPTQAAKGTLKIGQDYQGGRIAWLDKSGVHGLIVTIQDVTPVPVPWDTAVKVVKELKIDNYNDWRLLSLGEAKEICKNKALLGMYSVYWTATRDERLTNEYNYLFDFSKCSTSGTARTDSHSEKYQVRAIRNF